MSGAIEKKLVDSSMEPMLPPCLNIAGLLEKVRFLRDCSNE